ncbi:hypothetical protein C2W62_09570 [Candidatus Entotheonella serta]|nr:hypothetical protein C2W62_09570 [Candidatus Entotheonella serta]
MLTLPVEQWIGNAAAVLSGTWGAVTRRSEHSGYSRTAIYEHAERVVQAVASEQAGGISYETPRDMESRALFLYIQGCY